MRGSLRGKFLPSKNAYNFKRVLIPFQDFSNLRNSSEFKFSPHYFKICFFHCAHHEILARMWYFPSLSPPTPPPPPFHTRPSKTLQFPYRGVQYKGGGIVPSVMTWKLLSTQPPLIHPPSVFETPAIIAGVMKQNDLQRFFGVTKLFFSWVSVATQALCDEKKYIF